MSETINMGAAMTAAEIQARCKGIATLIGAGGDATMMIHAHWRVAEAASVMVTYGAGSGEYEFFRAPTAAEALGQAEAFASTQAPLRAERAIRKLALDIIDLTDQHGECTVAMLRGRRHDQSDIDAFTDAACIRAGEMSGNAPFEVKS